MRPFAVSDHVALKHDFSLYGHIQRSHTESNAPFGTDDLIIAHVEVPSEVINEFIATSYPPEGYFYVEFANPAAGCSIVSENDIVLVSRAFRLGDNVKQDGSSMTGTVIDLSETYILEPVFPKDSSKPPTCSETCPSTLPERFAHPNPHTLLYDVPAREVKRVQDVMPEDCIIYNNWVGVVEDVEYDAVIRLADSSIVVIYTSLGLHIPIPDCQKSVIAFPESNGFWHPDILGSTQGWPSTIPVLKAQRGDFVIVDRHSLRSGRWLSGSFSPKTPSEGIVLDCRAHDIMVDWISTSLRRGDPPDAATAPRSEISIYEDIQTFRDFPDLRLKKEVMIYDTGRMPSRPIEQRSVGIEAGSAYNQPAYHEAHNSRESYSGQELEIGMRVKFRDPSAAAIKYQGVEGTSHGQLLHVTNHASRDWNVNEYKVVHMRQVTAVMWQDGSVTTVDSTSLTNFALFETEILPTEIVLKREGMRQRPVNLKGKANGAAKDFDEMTFFERPHDLLPAGVGVVQSVDPTEKVARVRWYKEPKIELRAPDQTLAPGSRFGAMGDKVEDVSLFEIMCFPSLLRQPSQMCVLTAPGQLKVSHDELPGPSLQDPGRIASIVAMTADPSMNEGFRSQGSQASPLSTATTTRDQGKTARQFDWIGQIVSLGLDGSITARLGAAEPCRDVVIDADGVIAVLDNHQHPVADPSTVSFMDLDTWSESGSAYSMGTPWPVEETVEYEGGERLDNDSGDENWVSDEDPAFEDAEEELPDKGTDLERFNAGDQQGDSAQSRRSLFQLKKVLGSESPAQFLVLDREPPSDQFGLHNAPTAPGLKRILKEHQILATSLPEGEIYVRTYESRIDLLRCLIIGPRDTPYENAPFLIDLCLPAKYPEEPPLAHFHSWTSGLGRINPNLYEEGKICLSLLGTWSGKQESERWSNKATLLQVLVSLQGLVFVKRPFYNEAGFEGYEHDNAYKTESDSYSERAFVMSRGFVKSALLRPPGGLEDILAWLYLPHDISDPPKSLLVTIIERGSLLLQRSEEARSKQDDSYVDSAGAKDDETKVFLKPMSRGASVMLRRLIGELQTQLDRSLAEKMN
ncbi:uncharacterized protein Z520_04431 [Fonsecaea multimorphosa CBS 102226]|uniref:UBC core domain-containing protein n=1 Tax=Fonsecaea multimorphosa CBS 102226 TaxID=1442371 RepID=A0A0D2HD39_9EURO|nr:uncharacterized protein Z520_04431 [Fonsecaea multimorphosa CBS 102226]KIX99795.1 hypothetical protein Z520_04431 [Fonsecaea multimorphosa CBS 102226]